MTDDELARIRRALYGIDDHYPATLLSVAYTAGGHASPAAFASPPVSVGILDARDRCRRRLVRWCWLVVVERDLRTGFSARDVKGMVDLLRTHSDWLADHERAALVVSQLEATANDLTRIAAPRRQEWLGLGICPLVYEVDGEPVPCVGTIRAYPECDPYCDVCRTEAVIVWWERKMVPDAIRLVTADEMIKVIHREFGRVVKQATIRQWASRGFIETSGTDSEGRNLYDIVGVVYALARRHMMGA